VSRIDQLVHVAAVASLSKAGERPHTESSHKFSIESLTAGKFSGWVIDRTLAQRRAGVCHLQFDFASIDGRRRTPLMDRGAAACF